MLNQVYSAVPNDVISAARWNNEFGNIYNNGTNVAFPLTTNVSFAGYTITLDASGASSLASSALQGLLFTSGAKSGAPTIGGHAIGVTPGTFTDSNTAISGTANTFASVAIARPTLAATNTGVINTDATTLYVANSPANGTNVTVTNPWSIWVDNGHVRFDGDLRVDGNLRGNAATAGHIHGLTLSNNGSDATNDIDIAIGIATSNDSVLLSRRTMALTSALTKQLDAAWAVGTNQGMLDTGAIANGTYHIYEIMRPDTGVVDVLASTSASSPTMPASYTFKRRIGSILRESAAIVPFKQRGDLFQRVTVKQDINASNAGSSAVTRTLSVPLGIKVEAWLAALYTNGTTANDSVYLSDLDTTDSASDRSTFFSLAAAGGTSQWAAADFYILTNTSGQIRSRSEAGSTNDILRISVKGWIDTRERVV